MNPQARAYYQRKRREGKAHWPALRSLARYLCRIAFRMLSRGRTYQEVTADATPTATPTATPGVPREPDPPVRSDPAGHVHTDLRRRRPPDVSDGSSLDKLVPDAT